MAIGIIGSGTIGKLLAKQFIEAGNHVVISNRRGPSSLVQVVSELGSGAVAGTVEEAAKQNIVLLAVPWDNVTEVISSLPAWDGRILIDATNQFSPMSLPTEKSALRGSELIASLAHGAQVIKAFNTLFGEYMDGQTPNGRRVLFYAGDDKQAKRTVAELFTNMRYYPVDVGNLSFGNQLMQLGGILSGTHFVQVNGEDTAMSKVIIVPTAGEPNVFQIGNEVVDSPDRLEVKVAQKAIGINYADVLARKGLLPSSMAPLPLVDGFDAAGVVIEIGADVKNIKVGDRVAYFLQLGAYREVRNMPVAAIVPIPDNVSFEAAATLLTKGITAKMLAQKLQPIEVGKGYSVLVQAAAGGVATLLVRLLKHIGITVFGIVSSEAKRKTTLENGADEVILSSDGNITQRILELTQGTGVDAVFDGVGAATMALSVGALKDGGKLVFYGSHSGMATSEQVKTAAGGKDVTYIYGQVGEYVEAVGGSANAASEIFVLIEQGVFDDSMVRTYAFEDIVDVHTKMENRQTNGVISLIV